MEAERKKKKTNVKEKTRGEFFTGYGCSTPQNIKHLGWAARRVMNWRKKTK